MSAKRYYFVVNEHLAETRFDGHRYWTSDVDNASHIPSRIAYASDVIYLASDTDVRIIKTRYEQLETAVVDLDEFA